MGTSITDWALVDGAYYVGLGGGEVAWTIICLILTVGALVVGGMSESAAYKKLKQ